MKCITVVVLLSEITYVTCDCGSPPVVENSSNNATQQGTYPVGYAVRYTCKVGHEPEGTVVIVCMDGGWQGQLRCREVFCPAVNPPDNGRIVGSPSYTVGSFITFECNEGYELKGSSQILCRTDLQFETSPPVCKVKMCPEFGSVENGKTFQETAGGIENDYESVIKITCDPGYILDDSSKVTCKADGTWSQRPTCKEIECPPFKGIDSNCVENFVLFQTLYYMVCNNATFTRVAGPDKDAPNVCENGIWKFQEFACYCSCNMTSYNSSSMKISNLTNGYLPHGEVLQWSCNYGCTRNTTDDIQCVDGEIMHMPQCDCSSSTGMTTYSNTDGNSTTSPKTDPFTTDTTQSDIIKDGASTMSPEPAPSFPVWAIILIVVGVICILGLGIVVVYKMKFSY